MKGSRAARTASLLSAQAFWQKNGHRKNWMVLWLKRFKAEKTRFFQFGMTLIKRHSCRDPRCWRTASLENPEREFKHLYVKSWTQPSSHRPYSRHSRANPPASNHTRSEERRVGKECRSRWAPHD